MTFSDLQPKPGDCVLHCAHPAGAGPYDWMIVEDGPVEFTRPDGTRGFARWIALCLGCAAVFRETGAMMIAGDVLLQEDGRDANGEAFRAPFIRATDRSDTIGA